MPPSIFDNVLLTHELMHNYHKEGGKPKGAFKVDIRKAYDSVSWDTIRFILESIRFPQRVTEWIMTCTPGGHPFEKPISGCP